MTRRLVRALAVLALLSSASPDLVLAQEAAPQPIEITAEGGIEWDRNAKTYTAAGAAQARRGELSIEADTLVAHYRESATGGSEIYRLEAAGNVHLASQSAVVTGDRAVYDVANRTMTVTGEALRLETATDVVTARDRLEYSDRTRQASAHGEVAVVREDRRLDAEHVVATLAPGPEGELALSKVEATGNVRIATPREFVRADRGSYDVDQQFAVLIGDVKVTQDQNQLNGEYAEVDLKSGVSRLLGAPPGGEGGKVKGLVLPGALPEPGG
ncbi:MAG TPA: LptA/OstA family protein [Alphaproteobacteria bacterium]|nr:LptA/OstA family protein [Alphaproteobacteria bacterium]